MICGECGYTLPALDGFPKHVFCKYYKLHMSNKADASRCGYFEKKPMTKADLVRSMSDEELAYYMMRTTECPCEARASGCCRSDITCQKAWLDWLREDAAATVDYTKTEKQEERP